MRPEIQAWWEQAQADLKTAKVNLDAKRYYAAVFFSQQAVEKALKACALRRKRNPQAPEMMSHSLIFLGKACHIPKRFHTFLRQLTSEYLTTRYPSAADEAPEELYDRPMASEAVSSAKEVLAWIGKRL